DGIEDPAGEPPAIEKVLRPIAKRPTQPGRERYRKPCLRPAYQLTWHVFVQHASQQPLGFAVAQPEIAGKRPGKFNHAMIEQRWTHFQGNSHGRAINLLEDVVWQVSCHVPELHAFEQATGVSSATQVEWLLSPSSGQHSGIMTLTDAIEVGRRYLERHDLGQLVELVARLGDAHRPRQKAAQAIDSAT